MDPLPFRSVVAMFHHRVQETPNKDAMYGRVRPGTGWYTLTWKDTGERVRKVACGLLALGQQKGDRVSILATTSPVWVIADLGILAAGGATTTIYTSNTPEACAHMPAPPPHPPPDRGTGGRTWPPAPRGRGPGFGPSSLYQQRSQGADRSAR